MFTSQLIAIWQFDYTVSYAESGPAALYRVKPLGHLDQDPDYPRHISYRCRSAEVLAVESASEAATQRVSSAPWA